MPGIMEIMQMCRLCLVKDQVNISIFDEKEDLRQIFLKITTCLPVKVEKDDKLPKKICDGCSYKLELLYQFVNTSVNAEKQLLTWLGETKKSSKSQEHPSVEAVVLKQEIVEPPEVMIVDTAQSSQNYVLQEENLPYESFEYEPSVDVSAAAALAEVDEHEMPSKRPRLAPSATVVSQGGEESDDDNGVEERIAKIENESEPDEDSVDAQQPQFISVASTSVSDQPGPSGVQKPVDPTYTIVRYEIPRKSYKCDICETIFYRKQLLNEHIARHEKNFKFKCEFCDKGFYSSTRFRRHCEARHNGKRFVCPDCQKTFIDEVYFNKHVKTHQIDYVKENFTCDECGKEYSSRGGLDYHMKSHLGVRYICDICGMTTTSKTTLGNHMRAHSGEKPFICEVCKKGFSKPSLLRVHQRVHTNIRPYKCETCGRFFSQKSALNVHVRIHTGYKPYKCEICQKQFVTKTLLKCHQRTHGIALADIPCEVKIEEIDTSYN